MTAVIRHPAPAPHVIVECWELPLTGRDAAERRGLRVGSGHRATGVTMVGSPVDPAPPDAVLWRRGTSLEASRSWLEGEHAPIAPWASRAALTRVPSGYVYEDPDVPGDWFATRRPQADAWGRDAGPFATRHEASLSLLDGTTAGPRSGFAPAAAAKDAPSADQARERAHEATLRAPMPAELLEEARGARDGWDALQRAWPEVACLPFAPEPLRQAAGRIMLMSELERVDAEAAEREAADVLDMLTRVLRDWVAAPDDPAGGTGGAEIPRSTLQGWSRRVVGLSRRAWGAPHRGSWYQLEERHLALQVGRLAALAGTAAAAVLAPYQEVFGDGRAVALASAGAFAIHLALLLAPLRRASRLRLAVDLSLIVDATWVTLAAHATGGVTSPLAGLYVLAALAATLVYSPRTGAKAAILASLGILGLAWHAGGALWNSSTSAELLALWGLVAIAGAGAAVGERELRRRVEGLAVLQRAGSDLLGISDPEQLEEVAETTAERLLPGWRASVRRGPAPDEPRVTREGGEALIAVPVTDGTRAIGVLECRRAGRHRASVRARDLEGLRALGSALGTALSRAEAMEALATASSTDPLTGLANRRSFDAELGRTLAGLRRHGRPVSLCLVDVDHFKRYNDTHGHLEGDRALTAVGHVLGQQVRGADIAARYGGEEFALLLPDADPEAAVNVAQRVRAAVEQTALPAGSVTVSIGVATAARGCLPEQLIAAADSALYSAKGRGRNRVDLAPPLPRPNGG